MYVSIEHKHLFYMCIYVPMTHSSHCTRCKIVVWRIYSLHIKGASSCIYSFSPSVSRFVSLHHTKTEQEFIMKSIP